MSQLSLEKLLKRHFHSASCAWKLPEYYVFTGNLRQRHQWRMSAPWGSQAAYRTLVYTICGGRVSPRVMSRLESVTQIFVVMKFWKSGHLLCILYCLSFLEFSVDTSLSHVIFQYLIHYFNTSHDISLSHVIIHYLAWYEYFTILPSHNITSLSPMIFR
jgi:hypothetical protein